MSLKDRIENNLGLVIGGLLVAGFAAGFGAFKTLLEIANQDTVAAGTYLLAEEVQSDYISRVRLNEEYISKAILARAFTPNEEVRSAYLARELVEEEYLPKSKCEDKGLFGLSRERLAARLLEMLQPQTEEDIMRITLEERCAGPFVTPEAKVEILAYLNGGDSALRRKAIVAYANCASGVNEGFLLARTIRATEPPEFFDAYSFSLWAIIKHTGDRHDMEKMKSYLVEIGAPQGLTSAFLRRAGS